MFSQKRTQSYHNLVLDINIMSYRKKVIAKTAPNHKYGGAQKEARTATAGPKPCGTMEGVTMLRIGDYTQLMRVKEQLNNHLGIAYGQHGRFIAQGGYTYPSPPMLEEVLDEDELANATEETRTILSKALLNDYVKEVKMTKKSHETAFSKMMTLLPEELLLIVKDDPEYDDLVTNSNDPCALWVVLERATLTGRPGKGQQQKILARERLNDIKQGTMSLLRYKEMYVATQGGAEAAGVPAMDDEEQAIDFMQRASQEVYGEYLASIRDAVNRGAEKWPKDVKTAYRVLSDFEAERRPTRVQDDAFSRQSVSGFFGAPSDSERVFDGECYKCGKKGHRANRCTEDRTEATKFSGECHNCGKKGHRAKDCRKDKVAHGKSAKVAFVSQEDHNAAGWCGRYDVLYEEGDGVDQRPEGQCETGYTAHRQAATPDRRTYVFDGGATDHMVNDATKVTNLKPIRATIKGMGGEVMVKNVGKLDIFGEALFNENLPISLISKDRAEEDFEVTYVKRVSYTVHTGGNKGIVFRRRKDRLYVNMGLVEETLVDEWPRQVSGMVSVDTIKKRYTKQEVVRADKAGELMMSMGVASYGETIVMLNSGGIVNCPLTSQDVARHRAIYGDFVPAIRGKMVDKGPVGRIRPELVQPVARVLTMHSDVGHFDGGTKMLVTVLKPINLVMVAFIPNEHRATLRSALTKQMVAVEQRGFKVSEIHSDGGANFGAAGSKLTRVPLTQAGAGSHEPIIERVVRVLNERCRAIVDQLPYQLPSVVTKHLVVYVANRVNSMPRASGVGISAREAFRGTKLDYKQVTRAQFGAYAEVFQRSNIINMPRSKSCIALYPTENGRGTWRFLNLTTRELITSDNFKVLPTPQWVIDDVNRMARRPELAVQMVPEQEFITPSGAVDETSLTGDNAGGAAMDVTVSPQEVSERDVPPLAVGGDDDEPPPLAVEDKDDDGDDEPDPFINPFGLIQMTVKKGIATHPDLAKKAVVKEMQQMETKKVWRPVKIEDLSTGETSKAIRSFMFLKEKFGESGELDDMKARLVAGGHMQDVVALFERSSPTVSVENQFMVYAVAASEMRHSMSLDVEGAYLEADITGEPVHMILDATCSEILIELHPKYGEYRNKRGEIVVQLYKALYGCVQSALAWYKKLKEALESLGFVMNLTEHCVFNKDIDGKQCTIAFHVDDLYITHTSKEVLHRVAERIAQCFTAVKTQSGPTIRHLGIDVTRKENGNMRLSMGAYTREICQAWRPVKGYKNPATSRSFEVDENSKVLCDEMSKAFHTGAAKVLYLAKRTRPEILTAVSFVAGRVKGPTEQDRVKLDRIYGYLSDSAEYGIEYEAGGVLTPEIWADAAYMCHDDAKSRSGVLIKMCGGVVATMSSKQKIVTKSSTEAELVAMCGGASMGLCCREFLHHQGCRLGLSKIKQDNKSVLAMMRAGKPTSNHTKHIKMRWFFVVQHLGKDVELEWCPTKEMLADAMSKPLEGATFARLREGMVCAV